MSRYENLSNKQQHKQQDLGKIVEGSFSCNHCPEVVPLATFRPNERLLIWKCSSEHVSYVEDFDLH